MQVIKNEIIEKLKAKGIDEQESEALAEYMFHLSETCTMPIDQVFEAISAIIASEKE